MSRNLVIMLAFALAAAAAVVFFTNNWNNQGHLAAGKSAIDFGEAYVGWHADQQTTIGTVNNIDVKLAGVQFFDNVGNTFSVQKPQPFFPQINHRNIESFTLRFTPVKHGTEETAEFTVRALGSPLLKNLPISLKGKGVYQKGSQFFLPDPAAHPKGQPLDFGKVVIGTSKQVEFHVKNDNVFRTPGDPRWIKSDPAFAVVTKPTAYNGFSVTKVPLSFSPATVGKFVAILEMPTNDPDPEVFAGIVIHGEGIAKPADIVGPKLEPSTISAGETTQLTYTLNHPDNDWSEIKSARLEGLPFNTPGGSVRTIKLPVAAGLSITQDIEIKAPAMDDIYQLKLIISHKSAPDSEFPLQLTIKDSKAKITSVKLTPAEHVSGQCPGPEIDASISYKVEDLNGASDVFDVVISEIMPDTVNPHLHRTPPGPGIALRGPGDPRAVSETVDAPVVFQCNAIASEWQLKVDFHEEDKPAGTPKKIGHSENLSYLVKSP